MSARAATVNVDQLLTSVADQAEELAEARLSQQAAETDLKRARQEMGTQCKADREARERLETDCHELAAECRELEAELTRGRQALAAAEADLTRVQDRADMLQHQLQLAWGQLRQSRAAPEERPWWSKLSSWLASRRSR